jgi:hypothetical protein
MSTRRDSTPAPPAAVLSRPRKRHELAEIGIRLLDEAHVAWHRAEFECEEALQAWFDGPPRASGERYLSYRAALDREDAAARDLERLWELAESGHAALAAASQPDGETSS